MNDVEKLICELRMHQCEETVDADEGCSECYYAVFVKDEKNMLGVRGVCLCNLMNRAADTLEAMNKELEAYHKMDGFLISHGMFRRDDEGIYHLP